MDFDLFYSTAECFNGLQASLLGPSISNEVNGVQTSLPVAIAGEMNGFQMALVTVAKRELNGCQLGIVNFSRSNGCQIGVVNIIRDGWLPFTIGFNFSY